MNVAQLRAALESSPDDAPVLVSVSDHKYREVGGQMYLAEKYERARYGEEYAEYHGDEHMFEGSTAVPAFIIY